MLYGIAALIIAHLIWGAGAPIFKLALENVPPFTLAFMRFFGAALIYLPFALKYGKPIMKKDIIPLFFGAFFGITISISFFFLGLQRAPSINYSIINAAGPFLIFLCAVVFYKENANKKVLTGILISLIGVLVIILSPILLNPSVPALGNIVGNLLFLVAILGAAVDPIFMKSVLKRIPPAVVTFYAFLIASATFLPFMLFESVHWSISELNMDGLRGIIYGIIGSSSLSYGLMYFGVSKIKLQEVGLFSYVQPIGAVVLAMILLNEYPSIWYYLGAVCILIGILIAEGKIYHHSIHRKIEKQD